MTAARPIAKSLFARMRSMLFSVVWRATAFGPACRILERLAFEILEAVESRTGGIVTRSQYQMRLVGEPEGRIPTDAVGLRSYVPVADDEALLGLISRAFAWHPEEQWNAARLESERSVEGFDAGDVVLLFEEGVLVAFCWCRLRAAHGKVIGEVVILGVEPSEAGRGLGRLVMLAGIATLRRRGAQWVYLYVEDNNTRAVRLYLNLGFTVYRTEHRVGEQRLRAEGG